MRVIWTRLNQAALLVLTAGLCLGSVFILAASVTASVSHEARSLQPGEVIRLRVELSEAVNEVEAKAFKKTFILYPVVSERANVWEGLVGIDLGVVPDSHRVEITVSKDGVKVWEDYYELQVLSKKFPTRRITVESKYVSPPQEELDRIRRESKKVAGIFSKSTRERFWDGPFSRPVPGETISGFGKRSIVNGSPRSPHSGTDFRAGRGTPIMAPNAGKVVLVQDLYFAGGTVVIDHGLGLYSYFAHLSKFHVAEGDYVEKGEVVGEVGATGRVTGPHLHWTVRLAGARVDPLSLMAVLDDKIQATN
jgi:hypothetical protein